MKASYRFSGQFMATPKTVNHQAGDKSEIPIGSLVSILRGHHLPWFIRPQEDVSTCKKFRLFYGTVFLRKVRKKRGCSSFDSWCGVKVDRFVVVDQSEVVAAAEENNDSAIAALNRAFEEEVCPNAATDWVHFDFDPTTDRFTKNGLVVDHSEVAKAAREGNPFALDAIDASLSDYDDEWDDHCDQDPFSRALENIQAIQKGDITLGDLPAEEQEDVSNMMKMFDYHH